MCISRAVNCPAVRSNMVEASVWTSVVLHAIASGAGEPAPTKEAPPLGQHKFRWGTVYHPSYLHFVKWKLISSARDHLSKSCMMWLLLWTARSDTVSLKSTETLRELWADEAVFIKHITVHLTVILRTSTLMTVSVTVSGNFLLLTATKFWENWAVLNQGSEFFVAWNEI